MPVLLYGVKLKRIQHIIEYLFVRFLIFILKLLPYKVAVGFGAFIGDVGYLLRIRYNVAMKNLQLFFGKDFDEKVCKGIVRGSYRNFGRSMVEFALLPRIKSKLKNLVEIENKDVLDSALDRGAILVTGHYGSWELLGAALKSYGYPIDFLVGQQKNILIDNLMNKVRQAMGIGIIKMGIGVKGVLRALKEKRYVAMLSDQDAGDDGVIVRFFDLPASVHRGVAVFAIKASVPILTGAIIRNKDNITHTVKISIIEPEAFKDEPDPVRAITQQYTMHLESVIRENPYGWFWAHRRFKSTLKGIYDENTCYSDSVSG